MAAYTNVQFTLSYDDDTTQKVSMGPLDPSASGLSGIKANIMQFNNNFDSSTARLSLSKYGALWNGISAASITTTNKVVLF